jgi:hypothetical protein
MGMGKPSGEFAEEMTEPLGWPDIDEQALLDRADVLRRVLASITSVLGLWRGQAGALFNGSVWTGTAADAGNHAVEQRINELASLQLHIAKSILWYQLVAGIVGDTKSTITHNVDEAHKTIGEFRNSQDGDSDLRRYLRLALGSHRRNR